ncbi:MAG: hypothetical protein ACOY9D_08340 [Pseudomonadota bacterium]
MTVIIMLLPFDPCNTLLESSHRIFAIGFYTAANVSLALLALGK